MTQYLLQLNYIDDYATSFSNQHKDAARRYQDTQTQSLVNLLSVCKLYCSQLDHCTLAFDTDSARMLAVMFLSGRSDSYTVSIG
jgi:hypothetical protein